MSGAVAVAEDRQDRAGDAKRKLRGRNIAVALALLGLAVLFYIVTLAKGIPLIERPM